MTKTQTTNKRGTEIQKGDIIVFMGQSHHIVEMEPYTHPTIGELWHIARASDGWAITLEPQGSYQAG